MGPICCNHAGIKKIALQEIGIEKSHSIHKFTMIYAWFSYLKFYFDIILVKIYITQGTCCK